MRGATLITPRAPFQARVVRAARRLCAGLLAAAMTSGPGIPPSPAHAFTPMSHNGVNDGPFLELMGRVEGPAGFNQVTLATRLQPPRPIVEMTIAEVLAFQRRIRASGAQSSAVGRFQFIYATLNDMIRSRGIDTRLPFDAITQTALARMQMEACGFYEPISVDTQVANCLARVWAALPVVTGPRAGRSHYHGTAGNRALVSPEAVMDVLARRFTGADVLIAGDGSISLSRPASLRIASQTSHSSGRTAP